MSEWQQNTTNNNVDNDVQKTGCLTHGGTVNWCSRYGKRGGSPQN